MSFVTHRCTNSIPNSISCRHDMSTYHDNIDFGGLNEKCTLGVSAQLVTQQVTFSKGLGGRALLGKYISRVAY